MQVKLKVASGNHAGRVIPVQEEKFLIGRHDKCQLRPKSESVSRQHCVIALHKGRVLIQDLKSRNGTSVNGVQLQPMKPKSLKPGDALKIGKLEFEVLIEYGLGGPKKPQVVDVKDAAKRTVTSGDDSKFEEVDITSWLDEADCIERVRQLGEPETRQLEVNAAERETEVATSDESVDEEDSKELKKRKRPAKKKPGKLPDELKMRKTENSCDAAGDALKKFFNGR